ncbi:hypothetical protein G3M48_008354 [Beauveria asiatica]|uniref:F-box domain-containing protein n=1 Tax=Beauveria asiatica TaxID=1069075 RepID=A0AAW0RKZ7_9HYPO
MEDLNPPFAEVVFAYSLSGRLYPKSRSGVFKQTNDEALNTQDDLQGFFRGLPIEIIHQILLQLDLTSLANLACTSKGTRRVVCALPELQRLLNYAPDAMRAVTAAEVGHRLICSDVYKQLIKPDCDDCNRPGEYLHLLVCKRLCAKCLITNPRYRALRPMQAVEQYSLPLCDVTRLPAAVVPGYSPLWRKARRVIHRMQINIINTTGWKLIDQEDVNRLCIETHGSVDQGKRLASERLTKLRAPYNSPMTNEAWLESSMDQRRSGLTASRENFAIDLESLASTDKGISLSDIEHYSLRANEPNKFPAGSLEQDTAQQLESIGRRIWNIFLHKQNAAMQADDQICQIKVCLRARLFGYLLLGIGLLGRPNANAAQSAAYLIRLGLALCKACINNAELECARIALQRITEYLPCSPCGTAPAESDGSRHADYASYYILRIALSWKDDRIDLAEHMYTKATQHTPFVDAGTRTTMVQILTQIGESFVSKTNMTAAVPWLRRAAAEASAPCGFRDTTVVDAEFRTREQAKLVALGGLVRCLTRLNSRESLEEANGIVAEAQIEFGKRRVEVLEMLVMLQTAKGEADGALTDLLEILLS